MPLGLPLYSPFTHHLEGRQGCYQDWLDSRTATTDHTVLPHRVHQWAGSY